MNDSFVSIFKLAFAAYLLAFWAQKLEQFHTSSKDIALSVMLVTIIVLLMCTQIYGAWAVWCLAEKVNRTMQVIRQRLRADSNVTIFGISPTDEKEKSFDSEALQLHAAYPTLPADAHPTTPVHEVQSAGYHPYRIAPRRRSETEVV
ncbi:hypothetical protein F5880DRAFT_1563824 [Lentinula raphanica]|nr:hypothetical protein F5880DRAFT_1563824 [Lentinula raphanica]